MIIKIPTPCHEDWLQMKPTEQGAFCAKCQLGVVDFSKKSNEEIRTILIESKGKKVCGNFLDTQLSSDFSEYAQWENQAAPVFYSKFIWACVLVFGLTLFTGCAAETTGHNDRTVGELEIVEPDTTETVSITTELGNIQHIENKTLNSADYETIASKNTGDYSITTMIKGELDVK